MQAVTTFLAVKGLTAKRATMKFSFLTSAFLIHIGNNLVADSGSSIEVVMVMWAIYVGFLYVAIKRYTVGSVHWVERTLAPPVNRV
jgi:hypothetical protein